MAGEIGALGVKILYAVEATAGVRPTTGYAEKASGATQNIADFVTGVSGLTADIDKGDVTPVSTPQYGRRAFIPLLYSNDGSVKFTCNINKISRDDWNAICTEHAALTGGKSIWWEIILPGDDKGYFFRGEPCPMQMPDFNAGEVVQGDVEIIESDNEGYQTKAES
jgi:hypothetical protein